MEYFKHDINASEDDKICDLLADGGYELFGYYWRFIEYLYGRGGKIGKDRINGIAWSLHMDADKLSKVICNYGLFKEDDEYIFSERVVRETGEFEAVGKRMSEIGRSGGQASAQARAKRALEKNEADGQAEVKRMVNRAVDECSSVCLTEGQADAQQNKIKENKRKENKIKERDSEKRERFSPPTFNDVLQYAIEKGRRDLAKPFYEYFEAGDWIDSEGKQVRNWKQKFLTWRNKSENKKDEQEVKQKSFDDDEFFTAAVAHAKRKLNERRKGEE